MLLEANPQYSGARPVQANREPGRGQVPGFSGSIMGPLCLLPDIDPEKEPLRGYKASGKFTKMHFTKLKMKTLE